MSDKLKTSYSAKIVVYLLLRKVAYLTFTIYMTIYGNKYIGIISVYFSVTKSFQKVKRKMDFGHFFGHL